MSRRCLKKKKKRIEIYKKCKCPNCGEDGPHFVGPSFGDPGFFLCDKPEKIEAKGR